LSGISWKLIHEQLKNIYKLLSEPDIARLVMLLGCSRT